MSAKKKAKKAANIVSKQAIEELGELVRVSKRQIAKKDGGVPSQPVAEAMRQKTHEGEVSEDVQIKKDLERVKLLEEEMAVLRRERKERDVKRDQGEKAVKQKEEDIQDSPVTLPPSGKPVKTPDGPPKRTGEQIRRRN